MFIIHVTCRGKLVIMLVKIKNSDTLFIIRKKKQKSDLNISV